MMKDKTANHYIPSQRNSDFPYAEVDFGQYIQGIQTVIAQTRVDLNEQNRELIIQANSPQQHIPSHQPATHGILLIHGLLDSPHAMHSLFEHYRQRGFLVRSLLLPGHGTVPGDLLNVSLNAWLEAVRYAVECCKQEVQHLYIAGFSTGATLALSQAYSDPAIRGLMLFAPVIKIKHPLAAVSQWHHYYACLGKFGRWLKYSAECDYAKYQSITYNSIAQLYQLSKQIHHQHQQQALKTPIYMVLSDDDETISSPAAEQFFSEHNNPLNRLLVYSHRRKTVSHPQIECVNSRHPEQNILDYSHICLAVAASHPHYGIDGDFKDMQHYHEWWGKLFRKNEDLPLHYGAITQRNLSRYHLSRLQYNPDFEQMMTRIDNFISTTSACAKQTHAA